MNRTSLLPALAATLSGCSLFGPGNITEDNWAESFAKTYCKQLQECERGYFESEYSDLEDCQDEVKDDAEDAAESADDADCNFEEDEAQDCVDSMHASSCEDFYDLEYLDDCDKVYDCDGSSPGPGGTDSPPDVDDPVPAGSSVSGALAISSSSGSGNWSLSGTSVSCSTCLLSFDADFSAQSGNDLGGDFNGNVTLDRNGYAYFNGDLYWGRGDVGTSSAYWYGYGNYGYYAGSVTFY